MQALLEIADLQAPGMRQPVNWRIDAGQLWLLYGPSGSGKSQLLKAVADLIAHDGKVLLEEQASDSMPAPVWRRQVMYFSAETAWWLETVGEHFVQSPSTQTLQKIGLDKSILQQHPDQLSSGEKQRLALLRGLAFEPKVLLLDETSANLDPESTLQVETLLQDYLRQEQRAAIWISHDQSQRERLACPTYCCSIEELHKSPQVQEA
ncbi:ABC transporter ATP-binding protein [Thiomicrorhabdus xiamenensis]|nr:ATP-binding cassette domain-containing protein [Thiomicrorhabdus xiamenensis]